MTLAATVWFSLLGYRDLIEPDEGRYAEIPREMVASGDWLTPRINGFKYFEKPALQYWATAASFSIFGESNATARLWTALIGFFGTLWTGFVAYRLYGRNAGFFAFVISVSSFLYAMLGHIITLDMTVTVCLAVGIGSLVLAQSQREQPAQERNWMLLAWAALGLATLAKGLIGIVLPGGAVVAYMLWQRDWQLLKHMHLGKGLLIFFAVTTPWFVAVSIKNPEFAHFFFIHEHFERFTTNVHHREGAPWYFVPILLLGVLPWLTVTVASLARPSFAWWNKQSGGFDAERFLWVFALVIFVFFSAGHSKLPAYILPIFPALAILAGRRLANAQHNRVDAWFTGLFALTFLVAAWQAPRFASEHIPAELYIAYRPWLFAAAGVLGFSAVLMYRATLQRMHFFAAAGIAALLAFQLAGWGFQTLAESRSSRLMADAITRAAPPDVPLYVVGTYYPQSLPFYLHRTITLVAFKGELEMGIDLEPHKWIASPADFYPLWEKETQAIAVFDQAGFAEFRKLNLPMKIIYENARRIAVLKQEAKQ